MFMFNVYFGVLSFITYVYIMLWQMELYRKLISLRNTISHELDIQPNLILSNKCLIDMAKHR